MRENRVSGLDLLGSLLRVLVEEWGYDAVRDRFDALSDIGEMQPSTSSSPRKQPRGTTPEKPTASVLAEKIDLPLEQKRLVKILAERYDSKLFLPTAGDIRYFFEIHGEAAPSSKPRVDTFRRVLKVLSGMHESALRKIVEDAAHSGPTRLGPLSEAMRNLGEKRLTGGDLEFEVKNGPGGAVE